MRVSVTNLTAAALSFPLPDGGIVPASSTRVFENVEFQQFYDVARYRLDDAVTAATATYKILDDAGTAASAGIQRRYMERVVTWTHADFVAATQTEAIADTLTFPAGARLEGYARKNAVAFAADSLVDIGFTAATDVLEDGQVLTATTEVFGAGSNALPLIKRDIAGKTIAAVFDSGSGNTTGGWSAGSFTARVFYSIPA